MLNNPPHTIITGSGRRLARARHLLLAIIFMVVASLFSACATPRWSEISPGEEAQVADIVYKMQEKSRLCPDNLDAEARVFWKTPLSNSGINGYLQLRSPSFAKLIINSPLGMVLYAFASDGQSFQILDITQRRHISGNLRTLAIRKNVPVILVQGDLFAYLTGSLPAHPLKIREITRDSSDETVWLLIDSGASNKTSDSRWLHLDIHKKRVLGYLFLDNEGSVIADISYEKMSAIQNGCIGPEQITTITGLQWGTEITIELRDIKTDTSFEDDDFSLPIPDSYSKQLQP